MKKRILALGIVLALVTALAVPMAVSAADNDASQSASTAQSTSINIVSKVADTAVTTITFPAGTPSATVSDPYNNVDDTGDPQVLHASTSEPVVRLKNTSGGTLTVWLSITTWQNGVVTAEDFELVPVATTTVAVVDNVLSADGTAATVTTGTTIAASAYGALYLEVTLGDVGAVSGSSTLTILGES